jgi:HK97 family phage portal protein
MIVRTFDGLQAMTPPAPTWSPSTGSSGGALNLYDYRHTYAEIYRTQPNVRICVDFLARNIAHVGLQVFRRVSDTDRVRLVDHDLARWLGKPNPATTRFRLIESLVSDLGIYFNAYWLKVRYVRAGRAAIGLVRLPPEEMDVKGGLLPTHYEWTSNGRIKPFPLSEIVYFNGYNPLNPLMGLSPLETLRRILAEEEAAGEHREGFWRNAARHEGVVTRPKEVKRYTDTQAQQWREGWQAAYSGGAAAGKTILLQEGELFTPTSFSAKDSEFTAGGKLRREICAAEYQIPQPFVGILEFATFSNIKEQHKNLYQDCLGPWFETIDQEIDRQLLVECDDQTDVYLEFNIAAKLAGSFEEQSNSLSTAVGKPYMKVNEARAKVNLPRDEDPASDEIAPQQGGPATPAPEPPPAKGLVRTNGGGTDDGADAAAITPILHAARLRQQARLGKLPIAERALTFLADMNRWNRELAHDLAPIVGADEAGRRALQANRATLAQLLEQEAA